MRRRDFAGISQNNQGVSVRTTCKPHAGVSNVEAVVRDAS